MTDKVDPATAATVDGVGSSSPVSDAATDTPTRSSSPQDKLRHAEAVVDLDARARTLCALREHADAIHNLCKRTADNVCEIGRHFFLAKKICPRGDWPIWLKEEFGWTDRTATNYIRLYELRAKRNFEKFSKLRIPVSSLYLLAAPTTPEEVRDAVLKDAEAGKPISGKEVKGRISSAKSASGKYRHRASRAGNAKPQQGNVLEGVDWWKQAPLEARANFIDSVGLNSILESMKKRDLDRLAEKFRSEQVAPVIDAVATDEDPDSGIPRLLDRRPSISAVPKPKPGEETAPTLEQATRSVASVLAPFSGELRKEICRRAMAWLSFEPMDLQQPSAKQ